MTGPRATTSRRKRLGEHYTPRALADAVATRLVEQLDRDKALTVLDPACGDGALLAAFSRAAATNGLACSLRGMDVSADGITSARGAFAPPVTPTFECADFLESWPVAPGDLFAAGAPVTRPDVIIANPPYVRTQVLGRARSAALAARSGFRDRIDLAYAFVIGMVDALADDGHFAFILSNKVLTIRSGRGVRAYLERETELTELWDLGDTKLFDAAVLPCVLFGRKRRGAAVRGIPFRSAYSVTNGDSPPAREPVLNDASLLKRLRETESSRLVQWRGEPYRLRAGPLDVTSDGVWVLGGTASTQLQRHLARTRVVRFRDVLDVKVGIKSTADAVFIRDDWDALPVAERPEDVLLQPVRLASETRRWTLDSPSALRMRMLYPYEAGAERRLPIDLRAFPRAAAYLARHRTRLEGRRYVVDGGRRWWEPWVPHYPAAWRQARLVFPEIAPMLTMAREHDGVLPSGSVFWAVVRAQGGTELLAAACALANARFTVDYYDQMLGTRLYAGRRRWNSQHVGALPFPTDDGTVHELASRHHAIVTAVQHGAVEERARLERDLDDYCARRFTVGASGEPAGR